MSSANRMFLLFAVLALQCSAQPPTKSILFTNPQLNPKRCSELFSNLLKNKEFENLTKFLIQPLFLKELPVPAPTADLEIQNQTVNDPTIEVPIGPDYFYGPSFFKINNDSTQTSSWDFDLDFSFQNQVIKFVLDHLTSGQGLVKLAYAFDSKAERKLHPFNESDFQILQERAGQFLLYRLEDYVDVEDTLSRILVDGANVLVLNVEQDVAIRILRKAEEKNILQHPFSWLVFNAGITLSRVNFNVNDTNFFAIELSTNGKLDEFPEFKTLPEPITPTDLIFRDMAVAGLQQLAEQLSQAVPQDIPVITYSKSADAWKFYSFMTTNFNSETFFGVNINNTLLPSGSLQDLKPPPTRELLLARIRLKPLRLGTIVIPPLITMKTDKNGTENVNGSDIVLAKELFRRLGIPYTITVFGSEIGNKVNDRWDGAFGRLEEWDMDLLVGPFLSTGERALDFIRTMPIRSISYNYMYFPPSLKAVVQIFQFTVAFHGYTWLLIFITAVLFGCCLALLHKISPNSLSYGIHPAMIFVFGYLFMGVRTRPPSRASSQILIVVWWFFCLVLIIAFCANYAAHRSYTALENLPNTISTLIHQDYYKYAYINGTVTDLQMSQSMDPDIYGLYKLINTNFQDVVPNNRSVGIEQAIEGRFALIDESPFIEYYSRKYCMQSSSALWFGTYVFYMPKLMPYYQIIDEELALMTADGTIDRIFEETEAEMLAALPGVCGATFEVQAIQAMSNPLVNWSDYSIEFSTALGIFIICLIGLLIGLLILTIEFCLGVYKEAPEENPRKT